MAGSGPDGADSEEGEGEGGEGPGGDSEPDPFQDLPEEVSAGDKLKQTTWQETELETHLNHQS